MVTLRRVRAIIICFLFGGVLHGLIHIFWSERISYTIGLVFMTLSLITSVFSYTKIFLKLRQHQAHVQDHIHDQAQPNGGGIPLSIARYKKAVSSIAWVQLALIAAICRLVLWLCYGYGT